MQVRKVGEDESGMQQEAKHAKQQQQQQQQEL
jgi:hypothetical protein